VAYDVFREVAVFAIAECAEEKQLAAPNERELKSTEGKRMNGFSNISFLPWTA
jgi:hypothetical protein